MFGLLQDLLSYHSFLGLSSNSCYGLHYHELCYSQQFGRIKYTLLGIPKAALRHFNLLLFMYAGIKILPSVTRIVKNANGKFHHHSTPTSFYSYHLPFYYEDLPCFLLQCPSPTPRIGFGSTK